MAADCIHCVSPSAPGLHVLLERLSIGGPARLHHHRARAARAPGAREDGHAAAAAGPAPRDGQVGDVDG